jgi:uncharacterized membrane protein
MSTLQQIADGEWELPRERLLSVHTPINIDNGERAASALGGIALALCGALMGLKKKPLPGTLMAISGGLLVYRGYSGHCAASQAMGRNTAVKASESAVVPHEQGILVRRSLTILKPQNELYEFWLQFENLPRFMKHLKSVAPAGENRWRWVAEAPAGRSVSWDAEIIHLKTNELIAWRSLPGSEIHQAGSVRFKPAPDHRGTEVHISMNYAPPAGKPGAFLAKLFGEDPGTLIDDDLRRFKQSMEAGETATTEGQPAGRR